MFGFAFFGQVHVIAKSYSWRLGHSPFIINWRIVRWIERERERERERWRWKAGWRMVGLDPMDINPITKERRGEVPFLAFRLSLKPPLKQNLATVPLIFT